MFNLYKPNKAHSGCDSVASALDGVSIRGKLCLLYSHSPGAGTESRCFIHFRTTNEGILKSETRRASECQALALRLRALSSEPGCEAGGKDST